MSSIQGSAVMLKRDLATLGLECAGACTGGDPGMQHLAPLWLFSD